MSQCPCCGAEVEIGVPACPDCGLALGGLDVPNECAEAESAAGEWPDDSDGVPERAALLAESKSTAECALTQSLLRGCGIPSFAQSPQQNQFSAVLFGGPVLGAEIYVPESRLAEARTLLDNGG